ncbi:Parp12 [Symbiodinium pilosum]|uniref:Poly [ADP-ribose] polymerase n=1 Tax=Symbiodinium pilosum TaxID=2952 RepID=A0A812SCM0_SYMPI|nr:Parp12 [Symbiodinium pilosum]
MAPALARLLLKNGCCSHKSPGAGFGKPPRIRKTWTSADELHANFRSFCKYGRLDAVSELVSSSSKDFWCRFASKQFNETGLVLASKYGQHEVVRSTTWRTAAQLSNGPANPTRRTTTPGWSRDRWPQCSTCLGKVPRCASGVQTPRSSMMPCLWQSPAAAFPWLCSCELLVPRSRNLRSRLQKRWGGAVSRALLSEEKISVPYEAPSYWTHQSEDPIVQQILEGSDIEKQLHQALQHTFKSTRTRDRKGRAPRSLRLVRAERIENSAVWARYLNAAATLEKRRPSGCTAIQDLDGDPQHGHVRTWEPLGELSSRLKSHLAELYLFHGTSPKGARAISEQGFRRIMAGLNAGTAFGRGCYFAEASSKSDEYAQANDDGHFVMLLCRVVCGEMFRITDRDPLALSDALHSGKYDSVLADREASVGTYREFVVFDEECVYPEYLILYDREF